MSEAAAESAEYRYLRWRTAVERHGLPPWSLSAEQLATVEAQALRGCRLIRAALARHEAAPMAGADLAAVTTLVQAFGTGASGTRDEALHRCGLDEALLRAAIEADLRAGRVIDGIMAAVLVDDSLVADYYERHAAQQKIPELRVARHVLITVNKEFAENIHEEARHRIVQVAQQWPATEFATLAMRTSECPSALEGGLLGRIRRGQLYPALDDALFNLAPGEMSGVVESPLGYHLVHCDEVIPARALGFDEAAPVIRRRLLEQAQRKALQALLDNEGAAS